MTAANPVLDTKRLVSFLEIASRPSSNPNEALTGLKKARAILESADMTFANLSLYPPAQTAAPFVATAELRAEIEALKAERNDAQTTFKAMEKENARLQRIIDSEAMAARRPKPVDGFYTFEQLMLEVNKRRHKLNAWQTDLSESSKRHAWPCGFISLDMIQRWRAKNKVPAAYCEAVRACDFEERDTKGRFTWTDAEKEILETMMAERAASEKKITYRAIAEQLSERFGRRISENSIKGATSRERVAE